MKITIICAGKIKEKFYQQAVKEFEKRLSRYCSLNMIETADEKTPDGASEREEELIKAKEGLRILKGIKREDYVIALAIEGRQLDSEAFAKEVERIFVQEGSHLVFVIGGSLGLSKEVLARADFKLSFSKMTFPHQLMRVVLLEQVYRGFRIMRGEPYHK